MFTYLALAMYVNLATYLAKQYLPTYLEPPYVVVTKYLQKDLLVQL